MHKGPIKVLVVIARDEVRQRILEVMGRSAIKMEATAVSTVAEAVPLAASGQQEVALIDLELPGLSGLDALARFREGAPRMPVTILTDSSDQSRMEKCIQMGAKNHIVLGHFDEVSLPCFFICAMERNTAEEMNKTLKVVNSILRHDVMNHLTVIGGSLELYRMKRDEKFLHSATNAVERSVDLIKKMKEVESVISPKEMKRVDLRPTLDELVRKHSHAPVQFMVSGLGSVLADDALGSVFDNIISNALVHSSTDVVRIEIDDRPDEGVCQVRISDQGIGIPDEVKPKIWQEGYKYGKSGQSGLGLFIVRKVVERYGGSVTVEDAKPKGTAFVVRLRRWDDSSH